MSARGLAASMVVDDGLSTGLWAAGAGPSVWNRACSWQTRVPPHRTALPAAARASIDGAQGTNGALAQHRADSLAHGRGQVLPAGGRVPCCRPRTAPDSRRAACNELKHRRDSAPRLRSASHATSSLRRRAGDGCAVAAAVAGGSAGRAEGTGRWGCWVGASRC